VFKLSVSLCKLCSLLVVVIGCHKCSNEPGMSCSCKLFAAHLLFDLITEQINDDDDDDDSQVIPQHFPMFIVGTCPNTE